jgi:hypothetical protein
MLAPSDLALSLRLSIVVFGAVEFEKWLGRETSAAVQEYERVTA